MGTEWVHHCVCLVSLAGSSSIAKPNINVMGKNAPPPREEATMKSNQGHGHREEGGTKKNTANYPSKIIKVQSVGTHNIELIHSDGGNQLFVSGECDI